MFDLVRVLWVRVQLKWVLFSGFEILFLWFFFFVGGVEFNWVLFYLKQEDHQNNKKVNSKHQKKKKKKKIEEDLRPLVCGFVQVR